ncbi:hypothetical protein [uncultured Castellaniella sp.]|uniref:hypothetical protein n=1 Tax=uncultured Castellaniella sp. TaxID=647907 RepID=UPI002633ACA7|nr:hypothetical protein [uncultured Castellaniella sp.]
MAIVLTRLQSIGPDRLDAAIEFHDKRSLIRGPSDTGKSYIRDCLWYLLGGDKVPKTFPLAEGYQELLLRFTSEGMEYEVRRALNGGAAAVCKRPLGRDQDFEAHDQDIGELLVELSNAKDHQIIRSLSERGPVTGDDVRHWSLWSQTTILSDEPTSGPGFGATKRISSFNLFLTGTDDAAVQLRKKSSEVERIKGQLTSAEDALKRVQVGLPSNSTREDVADALKRVDATLSAITAQYEERAATLRGLRREIGDTSDMLSRATSLRNHARAMIARFHLLEQKYSNDMERLGAAGEGIAFFEELPTLPCPLCGTPTNVQPAPNDLRSDAPRRYRAAINAEAEKIRGLRIGLLAALENERRRFATWGAEVDKHMDRLSELQGREEAVMLGTRIEFSANPKELAIRRSELAAQLATFDEVERLKAEIERLKKSKLRPRVQVVRDGGTFGRSVANAAKALLEAWGFQDIKSIALDSEQCDLVINDRPRLSYGAGRRAIYLTALIIALMEHALAHNHPHLGIVVVDSPLKAYADPESNEQRDIPVGTVTDQFYRWLSEFAGIGQVIILENERISTQTSELLHPIEFSGIPGVGRLGFYPSQPHPKTPQRDNDSFSK